MYSVVAVHAHADEGTILVLSDAQNECSEIWDAND